MPNSLHTKMHEFYEETLNNTHVFHAPHELKSKFETIIKNETEKLSSEAIQLIDSHVQVSKDNQVGNQTIKEWWSEMTGNATAVEADINVVVENMVGISGLLSGNPLGDIMDIPRIITFGEKIVGALQDLAYRIPGIEALVEEGAWAFEIYSKNPNNIAISKFKAVVDSLIGRLSGHNETISHGLSPLDAATKVTHITVSDQVPVNATIEVPVFSKTLSATLSATTSLTATSTKTAVPSETLSFTKFLTVSLSHSVTETTTVSYSHSQLVESISASPLPQVDHSVSLSMSALHHDHATEFGH